MKLRQEQIVFVVALLLLAFLSYRALGDDGSARRGGGGSDEAELERYGVPNVALALPSEPAHKPLQRDLLSPPSDVRPLPLLGIVEPPRDPLAALFPPPEPGPAPRAYGELLRRGVDAEIDPDEAAELFADAGTALDDVEYDNSDFELFEEPNAGNEPVSLINDLKSAAEAGALDDPLEGLTASEQQQLIAGYKEQYDWIFDEVRYTFGRIVNKDRYGLKTNPDRASEPFQFVEVLPERGGAERFPGLPPIAVSREFIKDWDFADTFANEIEVRRREIGDELSRSAYASALALADECVRRRLDAPRALAIAEELYTKCAAFDPDDSTPRLGLARCYEAGFEFEKAFALYEQLSEELSAHAEVHARLGQLEARFFLYDRAEEHLREAVRVERGSWEARWALGEFLASRGRLEEAEEHLAAADKNVPNTVEALADRTAISVDLASLKLGLGKVAEAHTLFGRALSANPDHQRARAGWIATELLASSGLNGAQSVPEARGSGEPGLELLVARGLESLIDGDLSNAKAQLEAAAAADPLRAGVAWRALSYTAELAGQDGEAQRYVDLALENDPTDAWALYQAGRLAASDEDVAGARELFLAALDRDLDFVDALAALGEMAYRMGDFDDAERFLERAVELDPQRVELYGLRGLNHLLRQSPSDAREAFEAGVALDRSDEVCRAGLAWCTYLAGDSEAALVQLRELDDSLRERPQDTDPMRIWAQSSIARIQDHEQKVEWTDTFDRKQIRNNWDLRESAGPTFRIVDGEIVVDGSFSTTGAAILYRTMAAALFVAVEADVWIDPTTKADVGLFLARESTRRTSNELLERVAVVRHFDGQLQVNIQKEGNTPKFVDMEQPFPTGRWVRLRIERNGNDTDTRVTLFADGVPLVENVQMASLRANTPLLIGFVAEGEPGRAVTAKLENFRVVYRETR